MQVYEQLPNGVKGRVGNLNIKKLTSKILGQLITYSTEQIFKNKSFN